MDTWCLSAFPSTCTRKTLGALGMVELFRNTAAGDNSVRDSKGKAAGNTPPLSLQSRKMERGAN
eukprot:6349788-Pyramimonas_sp.AAC.1